jgi:hypothetical protein
MIDQKTEVVNFRKRMETELEFCLELYEYATIRNMPIIN